MKRILSFMLIFVIILTNALPAFAENISAETQDLADYKVISGDGSGYNESGNLRRSEFTVILSQLYGLKSAAASYAIESSFTDLVPGEWYVPYVSYSEQRGWMSGMGDGTFAPNETMTSQQLNAMYVKALGYEVPWEAVNYKADQLGIAVVAANPNAVTRGEAFKALRKALDVVSEGEEKTLGSKLALVNYISPIEEEDEIIVVEPTEEALVTAINLNQIQVTFKDVQTSAGNEYRYSLETTGTAVLDSLSAFRLLDDKKTVIITLTKQAQQRERIEFKINDGLEVTFESTIEFLDVVNPQVLYATEIDNRMIKVEFSKPIFSDLSNKNNYSLLTSAGDKIHIKDVTAGMNQQYAYVESYSDLTGSETITISNMKDYSDRLLIANNIVVIDNHDNDAPVVISYKNTDQNSVTLVFDSEIIITNRSLSNYYHTNSYNTAKKVSVDGNELTIDFKKDMLGTVGNVFIRRGSITDYSGNSNDEMSEFVNIEVDIIPPTVVGNIEIVNQSTLKIEFDQDVFSSSPSFEATLLNDKNITVLPSTSDNILTLKYNEDLLGEYTLLLRGVMDDNSNYSNDIEMSFYIEDRTGPVVSNFVAMFYDESDQIIVVDYNDEMNINDILTKSFYFYGNTTLDHEDVLIELLDSSTVEIKVPRTVIDMAPNQMLTIGRVSDDSGNLMDQLYANLQLQNGSVTFIKVKSVEQADDNTVILTIDDKNTHGIDVSKFTLSNGTYISNSVIGEDEDGYRTITFTVNYTVEANTSVFLNINSGAGLNMYGQKLESGSFLIEDLSAPVLTKLDYLSETVIIASFNKALNSNTFAKLGSNGFSVSGGDAVITSVVCNNSVVTIYGTGFTNNTDVYYNDLFGIADMTGNKVESFSYTSMLQ